MISVRGKKDAAKWHPIGMEKEAVKMIRKRGKWKKKKGQVVFMCQEE